MFAYLRDIFKHECTAVAREARASTWRYQRDGLHMPKEKFHNPVYHRYDPRLMEMFRMAAVKPEQILENWAQYGRAVALVKPYIPPEEEEEEEDDLNAFRPKKIKQEEDLEYCREDPDYPLDSLDPWRDGVKRAPWGLENYIGREKVGLHTAVKPLLSHSAAGEFKPPPK
eukprot:9374346-Pyramimonas_sp.AAC.1